MTVPPLDTVGSFESFVLSRSQPLLRAAYLLTGDAGHAEDLLQDSLARLSLRWDKVSAAGDPEPWVRTVMLRTWLSWRRRLWHREGPAERLPDVAVHDTVADDRDALRRALLALPPRQRAAVVLRAYLDLSEQQTAAHLGCSVGTVKSSYARGLARLRELVTDDRTAR